LAAKVKIEMSEQESDDLANEQEMRLDSGFDQLEEEVAGQDRSRDQRPVSSPVGILALLLALIALGMGSYAAFMFYNLESSDRTVDLAAQLTEVKQGLKGSANGLDTVSNQLGGLRQEQSLAMGSLESQLESRIADVESAMGTSSQDWIVAEVEYLLRMANQKILMEQDPKGALTLFIAADTILADSQGLTAFSLREAMATDIAKLEVVKVLDREGLYLRLSAFVSQVGELKQRELRYSPTVQQEEVTIGAQQLTFVEKVADVAAKAGKRITTLVDYRRNEVEITPILPPEEEYYLRQNLIMKLQLAQIALLERNGEIFRVSLTEAIYWINKYFDPSDTVTTSMRAGLEELAVINVQRPMPDVTASLREVRQLFGDFQKTEDSQ
jgi:uroporphyrin-3 C-methyltransferase|tara:strand:+ start:1231 stop:2382 length:1152 start_codon:yes stop_codon:yes gene_type:complete